ncbi:MAG: 2-phospho-L-lactate transferase [Candidatus Dormibacteraeota bacterium]|nr:2-phospho-L-lactate transferase [Candidatus Dormibacteraeota bacterium]
MRVVLLAGGTGGAKLATGLRDELAPDELTVITNPGDDGEFWGLRVCPDADAVLFRLAGIFNDAAGFGVKHDTATLLGQLHDLGEGTWFHLGDRDLAFHVLRSHWLRQGWTLTEVMRELGRRLDVEADILPATDDRVQTVFATSEGTLPFQDYFVRRRLEPKLLGVSFEGIEEARPTPQVLAALAGADLVVIGPSNPVISIEPILRLVAGALDRARTVAITPVVGGRALKGPTVEMLRALRGAATPEALALEYASHARWFVLDEQDAAASEAVEEAGLEPIILDTVMPDAAASHRLARGLLDRLGT